MKEHIEQTRFVNWLTVQKIKHTSIPSSFFTGKKNYGLIQKLKLEGWSSGVPDLLLLVPHKGKMVTVFIEMKRPELKPKRKGKGGVSQEQREWIDALEKCEATGAYVAYGCDHAKEIVNRIRGVAKLDNEK